MFYNIVFCIVYNVGHGYLYGGNQLKTLMQLIALNYSGLTYFTASAPCSEFSGSSKYKMVGGELYQPDSRPFKVGSDGDLLGKNKIENTCALYDYLQSLLSANVSEQLKVKIKLRIFELQLEHEKNRYLTTPQVVKKTKKLNKSKVRGKMTALFNLKCSRKFIAFFSVSFPWDMSDDTAFECWNAWLTACRKRFALSNYVWISERQENGTIHFHMLTNNRMPIQTINKAMAVIINNKVESGVCSWGSSSLEKYNGVDVDSIYNSKRHKVTGRNLTPSEIRAWVQKYLTKYVTKNNEAFTHLCWHCSRSVSQLFTGMILTIDESKEYTRKLPNDRKLYDHIKGDFFDTWVFLFIPPNWFYRKLQALNDYIFAGYEPKQIYKSYPITVLNKKKQSIQLELYTI